MTDMTQSAEQKVKDALCTALASLKQAQTDVQEKEKAIQEHTAALEPLLAAMTKAEGACSGQLLLIPAS